MNDPPVERTKPDTSGILVHSGMAFPSTVLGVLRLNIVILSRHRIPTIAHRSVATRRMTGEVITWTWIQTTP